MKVSYRFSILIPLTTLVFAAAHLIFEHFTGGVQSHHLLNRPDMPAISNWFGLIILPTLGVILGLRVRTYPSANLWIGIPVYIFVVLLGSLIYGVAMAVSFSLGATNFTSIAFLGLFICGFFLPIYRVEYILGFVIGMTITFGSVIPLIVALVIATVSFVVRYIVFKIMAVFNKKRMQSGEPSNKE